jgi:hypothetical protein
MKKQNTFIIFGILLVATVFFMNFSSSQISYCCEKTTEGAWCQNAAEIQCDSTFKKAPTSCESTSYCKLGTCINSQEGTCAENTPQVVCEKNNGTWSEEPAENLGQCQLGCCTVGDQTAYVTQTRCKRLSSLYGLETNYRNDINNELECITTSNPSVEGACVFTREYERTCLRTTKKECRDFKADAGKEDVEFFEGRLCTDNKLGTNCGESKQTTCVEGDDAVYYLDTCGNIANVYDSSKEEDKDYWSRIFDKSESCGYYSLNGNANSKSCGNCDYFYGSTCKDYTLLDNSARPILGNYICADLSCEYNGETYQHGETWCGTNNAEPDESFRYGRRLEKLRDDYYPGTSSYRYVCYNGDVTIEPCADYRQEICVDNKIQIEGDDDTYSVAACVVNRWQDCFGQTNENDCNNSDERDCDWVPGQRFDGETENLEENEKGYCIPDIAPGFDFWKGTTSGKDVCGLASTTCTVVYEDKLISKEKIVSGKECLSEEWRLAQETKCSSIGDCAGGYSQRENYLGIKGYNHSSYDILSEEEYEEENGN